MVFLVRYFYRVDGKLVDGPGNDGLCHPHVGPGLVADHSRRH
jgi:hypothetical protein